MKNYLLTPSLLGTVLYIDGSKEWNKTYFLSAVVIIGSAFALTVSMSNYIAVEASVLLGLSIKRLRQYIIRITISFILSFFRHIPSSISSLGLQLNKS